MMMRMVMIRRVMTMMSLREDDNGVILKMMVVMLKTALWCLMSYDIKIGCSGNDGDGDED